MTSKWILIVVAAAVIMTVWVAAQAAVAAQHSIDGDLAWLKAQGYIVYADPSGTFIANGDILPNLNNTWDLGSTTKQWAEAHAVKFYGDGSSLTGLPTGGNITGDFTVSGKATITGNLTANNITASKFFGDGSNLTGIPLSANTTQPTAYTIYKSGSTYYAVNGSTGAIDYSGANFVTVFESAGAAANRGKITIREGIYTVGADLHLDDGCAVEGAGSGDLVSSTQFNITGNYTISLTPTGNYIGSFSHIGIRTPTGFSTTAYLIDGGNTDIRNRNLGGDITINSYNSGVGEGTPDITYPSIGFKVTTNSGFVFNTWTSIHTAGYYFGQYFSTNRTAGYVYLNSNDIRDTVSQYSVYPIYLVGWTNSTFDTSTIEGNNFFGVMVQPNATTNVTLADMWLGGNSTSAPTGWTVQCNEFYGVKLWDAGLDQKQIMFDANTGYNHLEGYFSSGARIIDNGTGNKKETTATI